jgi:hypothetical protein
MKHFHQFLVLSVLFTCFFGGNAAGETTMGVVKVISDPEGATVSVDGHANGPTPALLELAAGVHIVTVYMDGFPPKKKKVSIAAGRLSITRFNFDKSVPRSAIRVHELEEGGADAGPGTVTVVTDPPGLSVLMNNQTVPKTTPVSFDIHSGVYRLRIKQNGNVVLEKTVVVQAGKTLDLDYAFRKRRTIDEMDPWK